MPTGSVHQLGSGACAAFIRVCIAGQLATKVASLCARAGWRRFSSAFPSIWRIRSRVTPNSFPISQGYIGCAAMPKRMRRIPAISHQQVLRCSMSLQTITSCTQFSTTSAQRRSRPRAPMRFSAEARLRYRAPATRIHGLPTRSIWR
jgi:hypothetical protein